MKEKKVSDEVQLDISRSELREIIDLNHELCILADLIDWSKFETEFAGYFPSHKGNPALSSRLVVGILYLKYAYAESDENVVAKWTENPYWQYFCGMHHFQHDLPFHPTSLVKWRKRLGEEGCKKLLQEVINVALRTKVIKAKDLNKVVVDTTVQEKAVTYPTDSKLQHRARILLVKKAKENGLELRQSYLRVGKQALFRGSRYASCKQMKRAKKQFRLVKKYLGCVARDIKRQVENNETLKNIFADLLGKTDKLLTQQRHDKNKLYSLHAPETECIGKGKAHKKYEFGVKTSLVTTHKNNFIVGIEAMHGNPYDGHTLKTALDQVEELTGKRPTDSYVDLGYRGHNEKQTTVHIARTKNALKTALLRKDMKRRSAIEPIIGHLKNDGLFGRNYLKNKLGDKLNALLCGIGYDLRLLLRKFRIFCLWILTMLANIFLEQAVVFC